MATYPDLAPAALLVHVLNRTRFGTSQDDYAHAASIGIDAYLDEQFEFQMLPDLAELNAARRYPSTGYTAAALFATYTNDAGKNHAARELREHTVFLQIYSVRQLYEVLVDFWTNHFNIPNRIGDLRLYKTVDDREVIRANAFGSFRTMLHATAKSAAMLEYLDNVQNNKDGPNENYARELLELHTLGVDGGYNETDVAEVARCFTGWRINPGTREFFFNVSFHDSGEKIVLGHQIPAGGGIEDGEMVLNILAGHAATARYVSFKLCRRFVSDEPPPDLVSRIAQVFLDTDGDVYQLMKAIVADVEFRTQRDSKFRTPRLMVCGAVRTLAPDSADYYGPDPIEALGRMGHVPHAWLAPNGFPDQAAHWISAAGFLERWEFSAALGDARNTNGNSHVQGLLANSETAATTVDKLALAIVRRELLPAHRQLLVDFAGAGNPDAELSGQELQDVAEAVAGLLLASPYYQLI